MAVKNHALDDKIVAAAKKEFLEKGYRAASLHKIAENAGSTTGALYTRYKNKDALFTSLVEETMKGIEVRSAPMFDQYQKARETGDPALILQTIRSEEAVYQELLFDHYEGCLLLFCRSEGSSVHAAMSAMMEHKIQSTLDYFAEMAKPGTNLDGIGLIMTEQFHFFRLILEKGYDRETALQSLALIATYQEAGWKALFEAIL